MYIGEIARRTNSSPKAVRHYEGLGLLGQVTRAGTYRVYSQADVERVELIKQAQGLGFRLAELVPLLQGAAPDWPRLMQQIDDKRQAVRAEMLRLQALDIRLVDIRSEIAACLSAPQSAAPAGAACAAAGDRPAPSQQAA